MKSRTLFFNPTVLKKNITRFAPVWALYSVMLLMITVIMADDASYYARNLAECLMPFALVNFFYAPLCAMLLFGDLYNSRMCNALHAMPLRRETWFATNVLSGFLFAIVPNALMALISFLLVDGIFAIPLVFWLGCTMQYIFFFGTAVLAAFCVGNRFAMSLVYLIINGFSLILYWLTEKLYSGALYGVIYQEDIFYTFSPVIKMVSEFEYLHVTKWGTWYFSDGWGYMGICVALGIGCFALALHAYRRRNLECAGDFIAIPWLSPIFLVLYTLCGGACCHGFFSLFVGEESYFFLILGFVIGFFTGKMLLERTVRVFRKKTFLGFGIFILVFCITLLGAYVDVLGIVRWVPKAGQVKGVNISNGISYYTDYDMPLLTDPQHIEDILGIHQYGIENRDEGNDGLEGTRFYISYVMKNGAVRQRVYNLNYETDAGRSVGCYMSRPELVLGKIYTGQWIPEEIIVWDLRITDPEDVRSLVDAIIADCLAENLSQNWYYTEGSDYTFWMEITCDAGDDLNGYQSLKCSSFAENTVTWLETHEEYSEEWEKMKAEYVK